MWTRISQPNVVHAYTRTWKLQFMEFHFYFMIKYYCRHFILYLMNKILWKSTFLRSRHRFYIFQISTFVHAALDRIRRFCTIVWYDSIGWPPRWICVSCRVYSEGNTSGSGPLLFEAERIVAFNWQRSFMVLELGRWMHEGVWYSDNSNTDPRFPFVYSVVL